VLDMREEGKSTVSVEVPSAIIEIPSITPRYETPCGYMIEEDEECGKPSVANQGGWYLCAEHHDL